VGNWKKILGLFAVLVILIGVTSPQQWMMSLRYMVSSTLESSDDLFHTVAGIALAFLCGGIPLIVGAMTPTWLGQHRKIEAVIALFIVGLIVFVVVIQLTTIPMVMKIIGPEWMEIIIYHTKALLYFIWVQEALGYIIKRKDK
jgi:hypothetical protein